MTPTIDKAALPAFQPGDRVLVEMLFHSVHFERASIQFMREGMPFCVDWDRVHSLPTAPAQLRAAAEVYRDQHVIGEARASAVASMLEYDAVRLESTSAPKPPPTVHEAAAAVAAIVDFKGMQMTALRAALAREGAAK